MDIVKDNISDIKDTDKGQLEYPIAMFLKDKEKEMSVINQPLSVRYKMASLMVLENLRNTGNPGLTEAMTKYNCLLSDNPTEEELQAYRTFREDVYPAVARLKDLQAKTIEALHAKSVDDEGNNKLKHERIETLTGLLKTIDHDIDVAEGRDVGRGVTNNVFIFNDERAKRIAARLTGGDGKVDSYTVEEESH